MKATEKTKNCLICNKLIKCSYRLGIGVWLKKKYCSLKCFSKSRLIKIKKICTACSKEFFITPSKNNIRNHCSRQCANLVKIGKHFSLNTEIKTGQHLSKKTQFYKGFIPWQAGTNNSPMKGVHRPQSFIDKVSGENCHLWKGGITPLQVLIRSKREYFLWRKEVFKRDNYVCQICGERGNDLNAHHIKKFSNNHEKRMDSDNGITLCKSCHFSLINRHEQEWESYFNFVVVNKLYD